MVKIMGGSEIGKKIKFFVDVFLFIPFLAVSVSPIQLFSEEAVVVEASEGVDKTVKLNSDTVRFYMSKTKANNLLKKAGTASIFIPDNECSFMSQMVACYIWDMGFFT
ncbi:hypothetical protein ACFFIF_01655 [Vagococcus entomophilus]|nr:hypothetical protein [Vagococcus entomophilus]